MRVIQRRNPANEVGTSEKSNLTITNFLNTISNAAKDKDYIRMRQAIIAWGQKLREDTAPLTLKSLAAELGNENLKI